MRATEYNDDNQDPMETSSPSPPHDQPKIASPSSLKDVFDSTTDQETTTTPVVVPASASTEEHNDSGHRSSDSSSISSASSLFASSHNQTNTATPASPSFSTNGSSGGELTLYNSSGNGSGSNGAANKPKGVCGLTNLGNTCYMNSALQCLSNTPQLSKYFLAGKYKEELNRDNPLGMKGHVAEAYGKLIETLWSGKSSSTAPREFKHTISDFNHSFTGFMQHDSQELLAFLLDGLHEDLNRILSKPYRELPDFDNMADQEIAQESWSYHKARNDSIIVDLFQGQFKSRLTCNTCEKVSTTFDPFMYLSLPLPIHKKKRIKFIYVPFSPSSRTQQLSLEVPNKMTIDQFRDKVAEKTNSKIGASLLVAEVFNGKLYKVLDLDDAVDTIGDSDEIYVYQFPGIVPTPAPSGYNSYSGGYTLRGGRNASSSSNKQRESKIIVIPIYCRAVSEDGKRSLFGGPLMLSFPKDLADKPDRIRRVVTHQVERHATVKLFEEVPTDAQANQSQLQPLPGLFKMKIIPEERSYTGDSNIIPTGFSTWFGREDLEDLEERGAKNQRLREEEAKRPATNKSNDDDVRNDVRRSWEKRQHGRKSDKMMARRGSGSFNPGSRYRSGSTSSSSDHDEPEPAPKADIVQGEGLILDWPIEKAEEVFGYDIVHAGTSNPGWKDVDMLDEDIDQQEEMAAKKNKNVTLADCLTEFTKEELLSEEDLWYCPRCKEHKRASKKFDLWRLPEILVVHLKRFTHTRSWRDKIDDFIDFPLKELDLTDRVLSVKNPDDIPKDERYIYDLYGVDNHFGGMGGGHYTACAQNWMDEKWYNFDDSHVTEVDEGNAKSRAAYLLFYKRRRQTPSPSL
ncbi:hypothetical protein O0I10_003747 [Lichtheimia ornata]|uniref:Ubiquitin carboxyl-terminal hydrolase n=1 Tax=Lichtheimia ornata TaxID=688661 RepID=A0AAD7V7A9_9FUNG|nr:uncharacterized protein O0I10_003747 [Lichtheimia ornata]KAJ8660699.1 hypothetical protein O0I10_003747 [Lichtheimia ornata]